MENVAFSFLFLLVFERTISFFLQNAIGQGVVMGHGCYRIFRSSASTDFLVTITTKKRKAKRSNMRLVAFKPHCVISYFLLWRAYELPIDQNQYFNFKMIFLKFSRFFLLLSFIRVTSMLFKILFYFCYSICNEGMRIFRKCFY